MIGCSPSRNDFLKRVAVVTDYERYNNRSDISLMTKRLLKLLKIKIKQTHSVNDTGLAMNCSRLESSG